MVAVAGLLLFRTVAGVVNPPPVKYTMMYDPGAAG